jgi:hypothetical protein
VPWQLLHELEQPTHTLLMLTIVLKKTSHSSTHLDCCLLRDRGLLQLVQVSNVPAHVRHEDLHGSQVG